MTEFQIVERPAVMDRRGATPGRGRWGDVCRALVESATSNQAVLVKTPDKAEWNRAQKAIRLFFGRYCHGKFRVRSTQNGDGTYFWLEHKSAGKGV